MTKGSQWFEDPVAITAEMKRTRFARIAGPPVIKGYDQLFEIARGGQGIVYRAMQVSTKRAVAIKVLLDGGLASGVARRRFEREIDLVASLRQPGIVSVYDSGATDDGLLYFVMEFIEGVPLDQAWPDSHNKPPIRDALVMLATVADAVQYAHQRGVIHRDLKPSNIRVDAARQPHVLDFGLAKVAGDHLGDNFTTMDRATLSTSGQFMGSLPWASPEQAIGDPDAIDARTDVYALGVIMHQVLTGKFPYDVTGGLKIALDNIVSAAPSRADSIRPEVGDEVSTIIAKALAKEPGRRYQSAGELARDIRHYLAGEPIEAKQDSTWYTVRKTIGRYRIAVGAATIVFLATAIALVVSLTSLQETRRQRDVADQQSKIARIEASRAKAVSHFVEQMLGAADPGKVGKDIRVVDVLGPASEMAGSTLADQPEARAMVYGVLSSAYRNLQMYSEAEAQARIGLELAEKELGGKGEQTAILRTTLAAALTDRGRPQEGLVQARQALELAREATGPDSPAALEALMTVSYALDALEKFDESLEVKKEAVERTNRVLGPDAQDALGARGNLANTYVQLGKLDDAIPILEDVVARARRALGPNNIAALAPISTLVVAYNNKGLYEKSEPLIKDAWERLKHTYGPESNTTLIYANNYAVVLNNTKRAAEAAPIAEEALAGFIKIHGPEHLSVVRVMTVLGSIYGNMGDQPKQMEWQKKALEIADRTLGRQNQTSVYIRNNYATSLGSMKRYEEAITEFRACAADADAAFGPDHSMPASVRFNLAKNLSSLGRDEEAAEILQGAAEKLLTSLGPKSDWTTGAFDDLIALMEKQNRPIEAQRWRDKLKAAAEKN